MLEYTNKYWKLIAPFAKRSFRKKFGREYVRELTPKADAAYREMLSHADDIGKENPMAGNVYESLIFIAFWKAAEGKITADDLREVMNDIMSMPILKLTGLFINANKPSGVRKIAAMMKRDADWLEAHPQYKEYSWDFNFDESKNGEGFYYYFTKCPINTLARREGFLEVLPVMCENDYRTAALMHARLYRESTLAKGGKVCDYLFIGDKK